MRGTHHTLNAHWAANRHTSRLRRKAEPLPRFSQPFSSVSPNVAPSAPPENVLKMASDKTLTSSVLGCSERNKIWPISSRVWRNRKIVWLPFARYVHIFHTRLHSFLCSRECISFVSIREIIFCTKIASRHSIPGGDWCLKMDKKLEKEILEASARIARKNFVGFIPIFF